MWVIVTLASLLTFIIVILCVPFVLTLRIEVYEKAAFKLRLAWLFGLMHKDVKGRKRPAAKAKKPSREKPRPGTVGRMKLFFKILRINGLPGQIKRLLKGLLGALRIKELEADFRVGLDNPAETGMLFAFVSPLMLLSPLSRYKIAVFPSFEGGAVCEGYMQGVVRLWPIKLIPPFVRFIFSPATMKAIKIMVRNR